MPMFPAKFGTFSQLPSPGNVGKAFVVSDSPVATWIDDGVAMRPILGNSYVGTQPPLSASWINVSLGTTPFINDSGTLLLSASAGGAPDWRIAAQAAPATPYRVTAVFHHNWVPFNASVFGMLFRESGSGKLHSLHFYHSGGSGYRIASANWNNPTSFNAEVVANVPANYSPLIWIRAEDNGSVRRFSYSFNGRQFLKFFEVSRTSFLTPDQVCWGVDPEGQPSVAWLESWLVEPTAAF